MRLTILATAALLLATVAPALADQISKAEPDRFTALTGVHTEKMTELEASQVRGAFDIQLEIEFGISKIINTGTGANFPDGAPFGGAGTICIGTASPGAPLAGDCF